jgi:phosphoribosylanthranilate isomerase
MRVKICGVTNLDDAAEAVRLGAWAIGLIHVEESPRAVEPGEAARIAAAFRRKCEVVGVFVNPELD